MERAKRYGVIVTDNLFGDILTDLAGAVTGGIGFAASANLNPARTGPSLFEPVHGAAHDIAGKGIANPLAAPSTRPPSCSSTSARPTRRDASSRRLPPRPIPCRTPISLLRPKQLSTTAMGDAIAERL